MPAHSWFSSLTTKSDTGSLPKSLPDENRTKSLNPLKSIGNIIQLTEDQMNEYNREGFLVVRKVIPAEVVDRVLDAAFQ